MADTPSWINLEEFNEEPKTPTGISAEARGAALEELGMQKPDVAPWINLEEFTGGPAVPVEAEEEPPSWLDLEEFGVDVAGPPVQPEGGEFDAPEDPVQALMEWESPLGQAVGVAEEAPLELFPGLSVSPDVEAARLPEALPEEVPAVIEKDNKGRLKGSELRRAWARTKYLYDNAPTPKLKVEAVGDFVHRWRPGLAKRAGYVEGGYEEAEGLFWVFDLVDKFTARPPRVLVRALRDLEVKRAAGELAGEDDVDFGDMLESIGRMWEDDKGYPEHGESMLRDAMLYFGGSDDPEEVLKEEAAKMRGESWADEALDTSAEYLNRIGWEIAKHPIIAGASAGVLPGGVVGSFIPIPGVGTGLGMLGGAIAGGIGGAMIDADVSEEVWERAKEESIAAGSEGGHFAQGLITLVAFDPLNALSLGKFRGATDSAKDLINKGMGVTRKGDEVIEAEAVYYQRAGRQQFVQDILDKAPDSPEAVKLGRLSNQIDRAEEALDRATRGAQLREGLAEAAAARGADDLDAFNDVRAATQENARIAQEALDNLTGQFDEAIDGFKGDLPKVPRSVAQAEITASKDLQQAAVTAFRGGVEVRGAFAPRLLGELRELATRLNVGMDEAERAWQAGLRVADEQRLILVGFEVGSDSLGVSLRTKPVLKDVGASRVYEMARRGDLGVDARIASQRPQYNALEKLLNKRPGKSFRALADELAEVSYVPKEGAGRFFDLTYIPRKLLTTTEGGAQVQALRGEAANIKRLLADPKIKGAARAGLKKRLKDLKRMHKEASSKGGLTREARLLEEELLVNNVNPAMMTMVRRLLKGYEWLDPLRRGLQTLGRGTLSIHGGRPQTYTKIVNGKRMLLRREEMVYPPAHYHMELLEQGRHRARSLGKVMWPSVKAKLLTITNDEDMLELAREFVEKGYANPLEGVEGSEQLIAAIAIRNLNDTLNKISTLGAQSIIRGKGYQLLSKLETDQAVKALEILAAEPFNMDITSLSSAIREYGDITAGIMETRKAYADWTAGGTLDLAQRQRLLGDARIQMDVFEGAYSKIIYEKRLMAAELEVAEKAELVRPELQRLQGEVNRIDDLLGRKEFTAEEAMDDLIDELLLTAEDMPGVDLNRDELIPLAIPRKPEYLEAARGMETEALVAHRNLLRDQIAEMFDAAAANTVMDVMDRWAQIALEQGKITRKEEWYQQVTGIYDVRGAFDEAVGPDIFLSRTGKRAIETPEFKRWFEGSKVVDKDGNPLRVYHGTYADFDAFFTGEEMGAHFGTAIAAKDRLSGLGRAKYPPSGRPKTIPAYLSIKNPYRMSDGLWDGPSVVRQIVDDDGLDFSKWSGGKRGLIDDVEAGGDSAPVQDFLRRNGYDGIVYRNAEEGRRDVGGIDTMDDSYIAFEPTQIKSTQNVGTFDPSDPRILHHTMTEAMGPGMLFHEYEAAPIFYSQLYRSLENVGIPKTVRFFSDGESFVESLIKADIPESVIDELNLREWPLIAEKQAKAAEVFDSRYKGRPEGREAAREAAIGNVSFRPSELRDYIQSQGFEAEDVLNRLVGGDVSVKDLSKIVKNLGVEVKNTALAELLVDEILIRLGESAAQDVRLLETIQLPDLDFIARRELAPNREEFNFYIKGEGVGPDVANRRANAKRLAAELRKQGFVAKVRVKKEGAAKQELVVTAKVKGGLKDKEALADIISKSRHGLADALRSPLVQDVTIPREKLLNWVDTFRTQIADDVRGYYADKGNLGRRLGQRGKLLPWEYLAEEIVGRPLLSDDYIGGPSPRLDEYMKANPLGPRDEILDSTTYVPDDSGPIVLEAASDYTIESLVPNREKGVFEADIEFSAPADFELGEEAYKFVVKRDIDPSELGVTDETFNRFSRHYETTEWDQRWTPRRFERTKQSLMGELTDEIPYSDESPFEIGMDLTTPGLEKYTAWPIINVGESASGVVTTKSAQHFPGLKDIIAHLRFGVRTGPEGKRWIHIEEIQSDTAQSLNAAKRGDVATRLTEDLYGLGDSGRTASGEEALWERLALDRGVEAADETAAIAEDTISWLNEAKVALGSAAFKRIVDELPDEALWSEFNGYDPRTMSAGNLDGLALEDFGKLVDALVSSKGGIGETANAGRQAGISADTKIPYEKGWIDLAIKRLVAFAIDEADEPIHGIAWTTGDVQDTRYLGVAKEALANQYDVAMPARFKSLYGGKDAGGIELKDFSFKVSDDVIDELGSAGDVGRNLEDFIDDLRDGDVFDSWGGVLPPDGVIWYIYKNLGKEGRKRYGVKDVDTSFNVKFLTIDALLNSKLAKIPVKDIDFGSEVHGFEITPQLKEGVRKGQAFHHLKDKIVRGAMKLEEEGRVSIHAFESATVGTLVHEMGHVLRRNLKEGELKTVKDWLVGEASRLGKLPREELSKDIAHLFEAEGPVRVIDNKGNFTREGEELFARGFERYLIEGKAPQGASSAVVKAFEKMKEWLTEIYKTVTGNDVEVSPEIRRVFDRYIAGKEQPKVAEKPVWKIKLADIGPGPRLGDTMEEARALHRGFVDAALKRGEDVPIEVLMDYKDLLIAMGDKAAKLADVNVKRAGKNLREAARLLQDIDSGKAKKGASEGAIKSAKRAFGILKRTGANKKLLKIARKVKQLEEAQAGQEFAVKGGSRERHLLEALKSKYEDQTGQLLQQLDADREIARADAKRAAALLTRDILRGEPGIRGEKRAQLEEAINLVLAKFGKGAEPLNVLQQGATKGIIAKASMALPDRIVQAEAVVEKLLKENQAGSRVKSKLKNAKKKLADLKRQAQPIQEQVLAGPQAPKEALEAGIEMFRAEEKLLGRELGGVQPEAKSLIERINDIEGDLDSLKKFAEGMNYDLRHPSDIRAEIYSARESYFNNVQVAKDKYDTGMQAFRDAETARAMEGMSPTEIERVKRLVRDPELHDLTVGKETLLKASRADVSRLSTSIQKLKSEGKDTAKQEAALEKSQRKVEILEDPAMTDDVVKAAKIIKVFFDERLKTLKENGILDRDFDVDAFFERVDIAGYIPHVIKEVVLRKIEALRGRGMLPKKRDLGFTKKRKIAGTIDEINAQARDSVAKSIIYHLAESTGRWGDDAAEAAKLSGDQLKEVLKGQGVDWNKLVDEIKSDAGLDDMFDFFETDPLLLMERYNDSVSSEVADAKFIDDILDLFPLGREIGRYGEQADNVALRLGYERLSSVDQLQTVLRKRLPAGLRNFEAMIKQQLSEGIPLDEIVEELVKQGVNPDLITPDIIQGFAAKQWYVPASVAEYLRYMNQPDSFFGMKADSKFLQTFDGIQSWMKMMATISATAHLGRNWIGNVISSVQELGLMALDPASQFASMMIWGSWSDKHLDKVLKFAGREMTIKEWREFWQVRGVYDSPISSEFTRETMGTAALKEVPTIKRLAKQLGATGTGAVLGGLAAGPAGMFLGGVTGAFISAKPFRNRVWTNFVGDIGEAIKAGPKQAIPAIGQHVSGAGAGAVIGSAIAPGVGTAVGAVIGGVSLPDYIKMMSGINQSIEAQARVSMAMAALKRGDTPEMALAAVNRALRNYSDLNPFERGVLRRVFFFYTWDAGNVRFQLRQLRRKPRAAKVFASFGNGVYKGQFTEEEIAALPEHLRWRVIFRTGASKLIALSGLPHEPAIEILSRGKRLPMQGIISRIRPDLLTLMEYTIGGGKSTYYGKQWEQINNVRSLKNAPPLLKVLFGYPEPDEVLRREIYKNGQRTGRYRNEYRARNARLMYLAQRVPGYRIINEYMKIVTDTFQSFAMDQGDDTLAATGSERFWAFAFGQKPTTIDWEGQLQYMAYQLEQRLLDIIDNENPAVVKELRVLSGEWTGPPEPVAR